MTCFGQTFAGEALVVRAAVAKPLAEQAVVAALRRPDWQLLAVPPAVRAVHCCSI
jgi:hypothetical protein